MAEILFHAAAHPLSGVALTVIVYVAATSLWRAAGDAALLHPLLVATTVIAALLVAFGIPYSAYLERTFPMREALALVIVLFAVPLYRQFGQIRAAGTWLLMALAFGSAAAIATALAAPLIVGASGELLATLLPKSVTTAVAVEVSTRWGGVPSLTALIVVITGLFGAAFGPSILKALGVVDHRAIGLALGVAAHAIGTARAFQISQVAGAFASIGMILNALLTIALVPVIMLWLPD